MERFVMIYRGEDGNLRTFDDEVTFVPYLYTGLAYDKVTKVVYYYYHPSAFHGICDDDMPTSPYLSENGKLCRFINNQIVEINFIQSH